MSTYIIAIPFIAIVRTFNPDANFEGSDNEIKFFEYLPKLCKNTARGSRESDNFIMKHVVTRIIYLLSPLVVTISRIFQGVIGVAAGLLSVITVGTLHKVNVVASQGLKFTKLFKEIAYFAIKTINPSAGIVTTKEFFKGF